MLTDVRTYVRTDGKPDPYIAPCLRQARQKRVSGWKVSDKLSDAYGGGALPNT